MLSVLMRRKITYPDPETGKRGKRTEHVYSTYDQAIRQRLNAAYHLQRPRGNKNYQVHLIGKPRQKVCGKWEQKVHYVGYSLEWDQYVDLDEITAGGKLLPAFHNHFCNCCTILMIRGRNFDFRKNLADPRIGLRCFIHFITVSPKAFS